MRMAREFFKPRNEGVYLHVYNHTVSMMNDHLPLGNLEKEIFIRVFERYKVKYNIKLISLVVMGNHFHALVYCPSEKFSTEEAFNAYNKFHKKEKTKFKDDFRVKTLQENSNNISEFMREAQREFTLWFNKSRPFKRKGALWQDRFQCQLIQSDVYLWGCLKYIEMNPVRAGISTKAEEYKFSSFGRWKETHPYQKNFIEHTLSLSGKKASLSEFKKYLSNEMKVMALNDKADLILEKGSIEKAKSIKDKVSHERASQDDLIELFSHNEWYLSKVIGSEEFIEEKYRQWKQYKDSA